MKNLTNHVRSKVRLHGIYLLTLLLITASSCKKDTVSKTEPERLLLKMENKTLLSKNVRDLSTRLDAIKKEFYARKLDAKFAPKDDKGIIWTPEWSNPRIQTVNDSVSYVFYRLMPSLIRDGKLVKAQEAGAATYIMVKNEKEFYRAFFYLPENKRSKNKSDDTPELIMKNFTGKLLLSNLERKQSFLLDYKDGSVSDAYKKNQLAFKKLQSVGSAISYWETQCNYQMTRCTYTTYFANCGGQFIVEYSWDCQIPSYCQASLWTLTDYSMDEVCEQVWYPDPPVDPGQGGTGGDDPVNPENPGDKYELLVTRVDSIKIKDRLKCFDNVPTDENTVYSAKICADIPDNSNPSKLLNGAEPGHTFIELTKTNGSVSVTETFGFYPKSHEKATFQGYVESRLFDNQTHEYDASLIKMLNGVQFELMLYAADYYSQNQYQMSGFNCTAYALDVFNSAAGTLSVDPTEIPIVVNGNPYPGSVVWITYGLTPNGLYQKILDLYNHQGPGASKAPGTGAASTDCSTP